MVRITAAATTTSTMLSDVPVFVNCEFPGWLYKVKKSAKHPRPRANKRSMDLYTLLDDSSRYDNCTVNIGLLQNAPNDLKLISTNLT